MSDRNQERATKQRWAVPGGPHDRLVRFAKIALPSAVGVVIAFLALAPLDKRGDVSFILDKNKVENAPERMRVEQARYVGEDNRGQKFQIAAEPRDPALVRPADRRYLAECWRGFGLAAGPGDDRRQQRPLQSSTSRRSPSGTGAGRRAGRLPARDPRRHRRPEAAP